jgi:PAP2 superfamily
VVYVLYPVAPPRLAIAGVMDTVSEYGLFDLSSRLLRGLYNPVAVRSLHFGYPLLVGGALTWLARPRAIRIAGGFYPLVVLFVIVGTGNHYFFDAAAGTAVALVAALAATALVPGQTATGSSRSRGSTGTRSTGSGLLARTSRTTAARP